MNAEQKAALIQYLDAFLANPKTSNEGVIEPFELFDDKRVGAITHIQKLLGDFFWDKITLQQFKEQHEMKCREHPYWGFKSFNGQMQINQFVNNIEDEKKEPLLKSSLKAPASSEEAKKKIDTLAQFIAKGRETAKNPRAIPRPAAFGYVLSYFWEIQDYAKWPVYYNSSRKVLNEIGFGLDGIESPGESYVHFLTIMDDVLSLFKTRIKDKELKYPFWFVEHVLWKQFLSSSSPTGVTITEKPPKQSAPKNSQKDIPPQIAHEWLPPIIADMNDLASNKETAWSKLNTLKPDKAFESKLRIAFTLLGFNTTELGQGTGREPDGFAISAHHPEGEFAIVYDAKAREKHFSVHTNDREMLEYINKKTEELRKRHIRRHYYLVISSEFDSNVKNLNLIKDVFRKTRTPIVMMKAADLLFLVEQKLQDVDLSHDRLEKLFLETGFLTRENIIDELGIR